MTMLSLISSLTWVRMPLTEQVAEGYVGSAASDVMTVACTLSKPSHFVERHLLRVPLGQQ